MDYYLRLSRRESSFLFSFLSNSKIGCRLGYGLDGELLPGYVMVGRGAGFALALNGGVDGMIGF